MENILVLLFVNKMCNLNCDYCFVRKFPSKFCPEKIILPREFNSIMVLGGEPGLLKESEVDTLFNILFSYRKPISLSTNGLFIEKYYSRYPNITYIHHNANLGKLYNEPNILNLLVVTSRNIDKVYEFALKHSNTKFGLNENMFEHLIAIPKINLKYLKLLSLPNIHKNASVRKLEAKSITVFVNAYQKT